MKKRPGFSLAELVLAVMIFGFMSTSLATIYSTTNRHMFQNYRANIIKSGVGIAMRAVQNTASAATRIDVPCRPAAGPCGTSGNILAFATNVDQVTGCYPVAPGEQARWHYFCVAPDAGDPSLNALYYHTGVIVGGTGCGVVAPTGWTPSYPAFCGFGGGGTVTMLMQGAAPNTAAPFWTSFSRDAADGIVENNLVRVRLRSFWSAAQRGMGRSQRDVDYTLDTVVQIHRYAR